MAIWHKKVDDMNGIRESFVTGFIFTHVQNIFLWLSYGRRSPPSPPHGSVADWDFSQSQSYTCWQHVAFKSTSRLRLCGSLWKKRFHTRTSCPSINKSAVQSSSASGTSPLKLIAKTLRYQDASFPAWNCQLAHRTVPFAMTVTASQAPALQLVRPMEK